MKKAGSQKTNDKKNNPGLFGQFLIKKGLIDDQQLKAALDDQGLHGGYLADAISKLELLDSETVTEALAEYLSMEYMPLPDSNDIDMNIARLLPESIAKRFCLVAVREHKGTVIVAMADPLNVIEIDTVRYRLNKPVKIVISSSQSIKRAIDDIYHGSDIQEKNLRELVEQGNNEIEEDTISKAPEIDNTDLEANHAPVIKFVDLLMEHAVKSRASDIHIEPMEDKTLIRIRVDGILREAVPPPSKMQDAITTRIKIMSGMDIAEKRLPQDGRFKIKLLDRSIDVRVSVIPTIYGEKAVLRILDSKSANHSINQLGLESEMLTKFKKILTLPHGIIIVTGPTGSGKSTTLYSVLNYLKDPTKNITTVEDPVEYRLGGINQIQVKPEIQMDFAKSLRAILRQDPDIILIGEIRDKETIDIAIKASLTGHLVLSTFHTNDAPSAISRMLYMGVEPFLLASSLNLVMAQRLLRRLCEHCKQPAKLNPELAAGLGLDPDEYKNAEIFVPAGCKNCNSTGYHGRMAIHEFLVMDNSIREKVLEKSGEMQIRKIAREKGYGSLRDSGTLRMLQGLTSAEEVMRVTFAEDN